MATIPASHSDLLESTALAYLATIGPKGEPQVSAVWFTWDGAHLLFALNKNRQKSRNLARDPRVSVAIADPADPYRALEIRGIVTQSRRIGTSSISTRCLRNISTGTPQRKSMASRRPCRFRCRAHTGDSIPQLGFWRHSRIR